MITSKITSVIKKAERLNTSFNLLLTCGISLELSFLDAKDFQPKAGMRAEATFLNYIPMMLTIDGNVMFSRSKTDVFYEMRHLLSALETEIQAEKIEQGRLEFQERKSHLPAIFQHRILLLQTAIGSRYTQEEWKDELCGMELAQKIHTDTVFQSKRAPLSFYAKSAIIRRYPEAAAYHSGVVEYAIQLSNTLSEDEASGIKTDDFEQIKEKTSFSRTLRQETLKGDVPSISDIIRYHQSLIYQNKS